MPVQGAAPVAGAPAGANAIPSYMDILGQVMGQQAPFFDPNMLSGLFPGMAGPISAFTSSENAANQANLNARNQAAGLYANQYANDANMGQTQMTDVAQQLKQNLAGQTQDLANRGLNNSTIGSDLAAGATRNAQRQDQSIAQGVTGMQNQALGSLANLLTSQQNQGPNMSMFANLLSQASQANRPRAQGNNVIQTPFGGAQGNSAYGGGAGATARPAGGGPSRAPASQPNSLVNPTDPYSDQPGGDTDPYANIASGSEALGGDPNAQINGGGELSSLFDSLGGMDAYGNLIAGNNGNGAAATQPAAQPASGPPAGGNLWDNMQWWNQNGLPAGATQFDGAGNPVDAEGNSLA